MTMLNMCSTHIHNHYNGHFPALPELAGCPLKRLEQIFYRLDALPDAQPTLSLY